MQANCVGYQGTGQGLAGGRCWPEQHCCAANKGINTTKRPTRAGKRINAIYKITAEIRIHTQSPEKTTKTCRSS
jgi:hypothetical protein